MAIYSLTHLAIASSGFALTSIHASSESLKTYGSKVMCIFIFNVTSNPTKAVLRSDRSVNRYERS